jgi:hypothetical protein
MGKSAEWEVTMALREARFSREEFARRGQEIYERQVRPALRTDDEGKFVAIDIESAGYEMDRDDYTATERVLHRLPDAQIWLVQVGQPAAYRLGARSASGSGE